MPLAVITGPANSAKAAAVLDRLRAALPRGPLLVVPTHADVERYRRELADDGLVFGTRVLRFDDLIAECARRAGVDDPARPPLGELARERVVAAIARRARLDLLAASAATPGFAGAAARFFAELEVARVEPDRLPGALRPWGDYGAEVARLYGGYRGALERLGRRDAELHALAALDALRLQPRAWGASPVLFYGFDDLTPLQRDAVETLGGVVGADVTVSLPYEPGRLAFAGRASTFEELRPLAAEHVALEPRDAYYAAPALHELERRLFEGEPGVAVDPGDAVAIFEAGGERAELELVGAEVLRLLESGVPAEEIAVVVRSPEEAGPHVERVLAGGFGIPLALRRRVPFAHTAPGRALLGLLRCALGGGAPADALDWLRSRAVVRRQDLVDRLERRVRREGLATADDVLAAWEADGRATPESLTRVRVAARDGVGRLCAQLGVELNRLLAPLGEDDAPAVAAGRRALEELAALAVAAPDLAPGAGELGEALGAVEVRVGAEPGPGRVTVTDPLALRARRVRALIVCGLQEGAFPRSPRPEAFFGDDDRRELALTSGIVLPRDDDGGLGAERYLLYATVSRPEERLVLSFRTADDDGEPAVPSFFLDDLRDVFAPSLWECRARRTLGAVGWPGDAPTERARARADAAAAPRRRAAPIAPLATEPALRALRERPAWSPSSLESWAACPVRWFVERYLDAKDLEPDPEPMRRGAVAHEVLEVTLRGLREETGSARVTPERLPAIRERLEAVLEEVAARAGISPSPERRRVAARRLRADLERYLETAAREGGDYEPVHFEAGFGFADEEGSLPALQLGDLRLRGRIDRVDVDPSGRRAVVVDYKASKKTPGEKWADDQDFQAALYLRAAQELLGLEPGGAFYQPLSGADLRPRGLISEDADPGFEAVGKDRRPREEMDGMLETVLELAHVAAGEARAGALEPRPDTCTGQKRCAYPGLCRCDA